MLTLLTKRTPAFMEKSKLKKKLQQEEPIAGRTKESTSTKVPIDNLPEKFLWMHVKSGTKIRNVLGYALKEFPSYNSIVWTGIGRGTAKAISCAELFKRKHEGLHQVTKLCYVSSEKLEENIASGTHRIPEIHILLTKDIKDTTELGYQAPGECENFPKKDDAIELKTDTTTENTDNMPCIDRQSSTMEKSGKRKYINKQKKNAEPPSKKNKAS